MSELFAEHKEDIPGEWHEAFDALTARGKSPSGIKAAIEYVTTSKSQEQAANTYGVSEATVRNMKTNVVEAGPIEDGEAEIGTPTISELCDTLASELGWEEDVQYYRSIHSDKPALKKRGWEELIDLATEVGDQ